jgi:LacI family transcriptional regulator
MSPQKVTMRLSTDTKERALSLLRCLIRSHYFKPEIPSPAELSRLLRIPKTSIDFSLTCLVSDGLLKKNGPSVFQPNPEPTQNLGEVLFVVNTDILRGWYSLFQDWYMGAEEVLHQEGYQVRLLSDFKSSSEKMEKILEARKNGVMGLLLASHTEPQVIEQIVQTSIPSVILGNSTISQEELTCICTDNRTGMSKVLDYLWELSHRRIAIYVNGLNFHDGFRERFQGYQHWMQQHGLEAQMDLVFYEPHTELISRRAAELFYGMSSKPSAIVCGSDREAFELIAELRHLGIDVPRQVSIVGFDNNHYGQVLDPPITTLDICSRQMGRVAANCLLNEMQASQLPVKILLPTELIVRASTLPQNSSSLPAKATKKKGDSNSILTF